MADNTNVDKDGAESVANASSVSSGAVAGSETMAKIIKEVLAEELKPLKGEISGLYSRQDKDRNELSKFLDEFKKQKAKGLSDDEAEQAATSSLSQAEKDARQSALLDKLAERFLNEPSTNTGGASDSGAFDLSEAEKDMIARGLDVNDPEYLQLVKSGASQEAYNAYIVNKTRPAKPASASGIAQEPASGSVSSKFDKSTYEKQLSDIVQSGVSHDERLKLISDLQTKAVAEGVII